ncbi:hypothetical protein ACSAY2_004791 [Escherichia coli]
MSYNRLDDRTIDDPILLALFHQEVIAGHQLQRRQHLLHHQAR